MVLKDLQNGWWICISFKMMTTMLYRFKYSCMILTSYWSSHYNHFSLCMMVWNLLMKGRLVHLKAKMIPMERASVQPVRHASAPRKKPAHARRFFVGFARRHFLGWTVWSAIMSGSTAKGALGTSQSCLNASFFKLSIPAKLHCDIMAYLRLN